MKPKKIGDRFYKARTKLNKNGKESPRKVYAETGVTASSINLYESDDRIPNMENAKILADHYGVNLSWLLGESDSPSLDKDSQLITELTGLSPEAIEMICRIKGFGLIETMNAVIASDSFRQMIQWIDTARIINKHCTDADKNNETDDAVYHGMMKDTLGEAIGFAWFPGESHIDMCLLRASKALENTIAQIMKEDKEDGKR